MKRTTWLSILAVAALCGCKSEHAEQRVEKKWSGSEITKLSVRGVQSDILVTASDTDQVHMVADVSITGRDAKETVRKGAIKCELKNGVLEVSDASYGKPRVFLPWLSSQNEEITYRFEVPRHITLAVTNVNGEIKIDNAAASADVQSVNGSIEVTSHGAPVVARTVNGPIEAHFIDTFPGAKLRTVNGPVDVTIPAHSTFVANVSQVNGGFESNIPVTVNKQRGTSTVRVGDEGASPLDVTTVNGDITLTRSVAPPAAPRAPKAPSVLPLPSAPPAVPELPSAPAPPKPPAKGAISL